MNLSLWQGDRCVETFHLTPPAAAELIGFLAHGLADATVVAASATITELPVPKVTAVGSSLANQLRRAGQVLRRRASTMLATGSDLIGPKKR